MTRGINIIGVMRVTKINEELKKYIEGEILPEYEKNDPGHGAEHARNVIARSLSFAEGMDEVNLDMVYTVAAYHDIGHSVDAKNHEKVAAEILAKDDNLKKFFSDDEIKTMAEAVYDHRASTESEPRSVYGKIVCSADRMTSLEEPLKRTYAYRLEHTPEKSLAEIIEDSWRHLVEKYGENGYAIPKMYFDDPEYEKFLKDLQELLYDKEKFRELYIKVNGIG